MCCVLQRTLNQSVDERSLFPFTNFWNEQNLTKLKIFNQPYCASCFVYREWIEEWAVRWWPLPSVTTRASAEHLMLPLKPMRCYLLQNDWTEIHIFTLFNNINWLLVFPGDRLTQWKLMTCCRARTQLAIRGLCKGDSNDLLAERRLHMVGRPFAYKYFVCNYF